MLVPKAGGFVHLDGHGLAPSLAANRRGSFGNHRAHRPIAAPNQRLACLGCRLADSAPAVQSVGRLTKRAGGAVCATPRALCLRACGRGVVLRLRPHGRFATAPKKGVPCGWRHRPLMPRRRPRPALTSASCHCFAPKWFRWPKAAKGVLAHSAAAARADLPCGCCETP